MPKNRLFISALVGWPIVVTAVLASRALTADAGLPAPEYVAWLLLACAPVVSALVIARRRPSRSIAQILYDTEHDGDQATARSTAVPRG